MWKNLPLSLSFSFDYYILMRMILLETPTASHFIFYRLINATLKWYIDVCKPHCTNSRNIFPIYRRWLVQLHRMKTCFLLAFGELKTHSCDSLFVVEFFLRVQFLAVAEQVICEVFDEVDWREDFLSPLHLRAHFHLINLQQPIMGRNRACRTH